MAQYTEEEIRSIPKITCKIAADYLGVSPMAVSIGMRNDLLPIGFSIKNEDRYSDSWSYHIIDERLIAYKHGKITNIQIQNVEKNLETLCADLDCMFSVVEKNEKVVLLKDNKPVYIIIKFDGEQSIEITAIPVTATHYTLHEAMRIVLSEAKDMTMHASDLADEIYERKLALQKNGGKAQYTQV